MLRPVIRRLMMISPASAIQCFYRTYYSFICQRNKELFFINQNTVLKKNCSLNDCELYIKEGSTSSAKDHIFPCQLCDVYVL